MVAASGQEGRPGRWLPEAGRTAAAGLIAVASGLALLAADPGWFWHDDFQSYQLAVYREVARGWLDGEPPLLSPCSWQGGALAGEYQPGVFDPVLVLGLLAVFGSGLTLPSAAAALAIGHLAILATGAFRLGRRRGLPVDLAMLAATVATLNGSVMLWGARAWFPALASFAWLPWFWWALIGAMDGSRGPARFLPSGAFLALVVVAGWPFSVLMAGLLSAWMATREASRRGNSRVIWPIVAAWAVGLGLSAPSWMMLVEYAAETLRGGTSPDTLNDHWTVPLAALPGLLFPVHVSVWTTFRVDKPHAGVELAGALVPTVALLSALARRPRRVARELGWDLLLCVVVLALAILPSPGNFRWSFRWLPLAFLALGLTSADVLARWRAESASPERSGVGPGPPSLGLWAAALVLPAWLMQDRAFDPSSYIDRNGLALTLLALAWAGVERWRGPAAVTPSAAPTLVVVASCLIAYVGVDPFVEYPSWRLDPSAAAPAGRGARSFGIYAFEDVYPDRDRDEAYAPWRGRGRGAPLGLGNAAMYAGVEQVNGYSPMAPRDLAELFSMGYLGHIEAKPGSIEPTADAPETVARLIAKDSRPGGLLERMGVDALVVSDRYLGLASTRLGPSWRLDRPIPGGAVFRRKGGPLPRARAVLRAMPARRREAGIAFLRDREVDPTLPVVLSPDAPAGGPPLAFAPASLTIAGETRASVSVDVRAEAPGRAVLVAFARPWYPGYRATFEGVPVAVDRLDLILPAVRLPAGARGRLELTYRPDSLAWGCRTAAATALLMAAVAAAAPRLRIGPTSGPAG